MKHTFHPKHVVKRTDGIDTLALIVGIIQPLATLPQIFLVYTSRDASAVSLVTWTGFNIASIVLLLYGLRHKLAPVIWAQILWLAVQTPMMISVFLFS